MQPQIRVAVIGLGWVAQNRHIPQIHRNPSFRLAGVIDRRPGRASEIARRWGNIRASETDNLSDVPWRDETDAVVIATEPASHHRLTLEALALGKHVLTEKPFAMSMAEGAAMASAADAAGRVLCVTHNFQFSHSMRALLRDRDSGRLGEIRSVTGVQLSNPRRRLPSWYESLPLGLFYDESPHLIYLLNRLALSPLEVKRVEILPSGTGAVTPAQVNVTLFERNGTVPFAIRCNFEAPVSEWQIAVCGTNGLGIVDLFRDIYIRIPNDRDHTAWPVLRTSLKASWDHWSQIVLRGTDLMLRRLSYGNNEIYRLFAAGVNGDEKALDRIGAKSALRVLGIQHAILNGGALNG